MRGMMLTLLAVLSLAAFGSGIAGALADEGPARSHKGVRHVCRGPQCGPYLPCGVRCRRVCPDRYSCFPLYGAYGPYGGTAYRGAYTLSGWGPPW
jgi:hypothetical protein